MKKLVAALAVVVVLALIGVGITFAYFTAKATSSVGPPDAPDVVFVVAKGATGQGLGLQLAREHLVQGALYWRFHLRQRGGLNAKAGKHVLSAKMSIPEIANALEQAPKADEVPFAMIEGWRLRDTDAALAAQGFITAGAYIKAASHPQKFKAPFPLPATTLEGYLYPETYLVPKAGEGFEVEAFIQRQLDTFVTRFYGPHQAEVAASGRTLHDVVKMASMLEREEPVPAQRTVVAGILWKRIDRGFPLGVDATSRYELAEWNDRKAFLQRLRDKNDAYNTRHSPGLPPGPIGAPTVDSLLAAIHPEQNDYLYYLHDAQKVLHPSRNGDEHEALRKKYNVY